MMEFYPFYKIFAYSPLYTKPSIVTNKPTRPTVSLLYEFNLYHFFDHIIGIDYPLSSTNNRSFAHSLMPSNIFCLLPSTLVTTYI